MNISGSEAVIKSLLEENINIIFGYPGGAIMPIYDALYNYLDQINHILTIPESDALFMCYQFLFAARDNPDIHHALLSLANPRLSLDLIELFITL